MPDFVPYSNTPIGPGTVCYKNDYFTGDGHTDTWDLVNLLGIYVGESVQSQNTFWSKGKGSLSVDNIANTITTNTPADVGAVVICSGSQALPIRAYDNAVPGDSSPRVKQYPFYVGPDSSASIQGFAYHSPTVLFVDKDPLYGASTSWLNIAPSLSDGSPGTYQPSSTPLILPDIDGFTTLANPQSVGDSVIEVLDGTQVTPGFFLVIDPGTSSEEQVVCLSVLGNTMTISPLGFNHSAGAPVFEYYQLCWVQTDIPLNVTGGTPVNLNDIALALSCVMESRL